MKIFAYRLERAVLDFLYVPYNHLYTKHIATPVYINKY